MGLGYDRLSRFPLFLLAVRQGAFFEEEIPDLDADGSCSAHNDIRFIAVFSG
jgi:hypothetical protein